MSFNRRRPDRPRDRGAERGDRPDRPDRPERPERRYDRPARPTGDWQPRDRGSDARAGRGGDRPFGRGDRPYSPRPRGADDDGAMSIRLDPRRLSVLKQLAAEAGTRPGELVRIWVEERLDAERRGEAVGASGAGLAAQMAALTERVAALEAARGNADRAAPPPPPTDQSDAGPTVEAAEPNGDRPTRRRRNAVTAKPSGPRVALHDEIIAVIEERGPMTAADLASAISERGRYSPPRSGKPLDALTVNARVSNPTYRSRFTRADGRIGLAQSAEG